MEEKHNEATMNRPEGERVLDDYFVEVDLPRFMKQIKLEQAWQHSDRNAITVFKTDNVSIVLSAMHKGADMIKQFSGDLMQIQVIEGLLRFETGSRSSLLSAGHLAVLHKGYSYDLEAVEESVFLLILNHESKGGI